MSSSSTSKATRAILRSHAHLRCSSARRRFTNASALIRKPYAKRAAMDFDIRSLIVPGVRAIEPYQPGKPLSELEREYGIQNAIKIASNENPLGPSPRALRAAEAALEDIARYPDGSGFELKRALSAKL